MKRYRVIISHAAQLQLNKYIRYIRNVLKNPQAAKAVRDDAKDTKKRLSEIASSLKKLDFVEDYEYRKIHFAQHDYLMIYRIDGETVIVERIYHELQDYDNEFN